MSNLGDNEYTPEQILEVCQSEDTKGNYVLFGGFVYNLHDPDDAVKYTKVRQAFEGDWKDIYQGGW